MENIDTPFTKKIGMLLTSVGWGGLEINVLNSLISWKEGTGSSFLSVERSRIALESINVIKNVHFVDPHGKYFDISGALKILQVN